MMRGTLLILVLGHLLAFSCAAVKKPVVPKNKPVVKDVAKINKPVVARARSRSQPGGKINKQITDGFNFYFSWHALISYTDNPNICGGTLLTEYWLVTAAQCQSTSVSNINIRIGSASRTGTGQGFQAPTVKTQVVHTGYDPVTLANDIMLMEFNARTFFSPIAYPIDLPYGPDLTVNYVGKSVLIGGFGKNSSTDAAFSDKFRGGSTNVVDISACALQFGTDRVFPNSLCLQWKTFVSCEGDTGGSVVYKKENNYQIEMILGVISQSTSTCDATKPFVATNVIPYMDWIESYITPTTATPTSSSTSSSSSSSSTSSSESSSSESSSSTTDTSTTPCTSNCGDVCPEDPAPKIPASAKPAPQCSNQNYEGFVNKCCNVPMMNFMLPNGADTTCKRNPSVVKYFNVFMMNKLQPPKALNQSVNYTDRNLLKNNSDWSRAAAFLDCHLNQTNVTVNGTVNKEALVTFLSKTNNNSAIWVPKIACAVSQCIDIVSKINTSNNVINGKEKNNATALYVVQCVLFKMIKNCPDRKITPACNNSYTIFDQCSFSVLPTTTTTTTTAAPFVGKLLARATPKRKSG
ncbi:acrosin-like [Neocloeon triangulifer]|uniref:acrosin-like n=1 Tax=Neocloeon triangulifer TaxID=2078957 RepID=UPI00286FAB11|nr:acrosin-like [Neocloeon triangulifer]